MANTSQATQEFVPIKEIRDGVILLKDGSLRSILLTSSVNFALKSADEQQALIIQFQNFLNTLDFSIQIFIQSRKLDIRPYIARLEERYRVQTEDLLKVQTREYIEFIRNFTESSSIMTKNFFIVVPYTPALIQSGKDILDIFGRKKAENSQTKEAFEESRTQIEQRIGVVGQGLSRIGVRTVQLGTEEAIELFYKIFNPGELEKPIKLS